MGKNEEREGKGVSLNIVALFSHMERHITFTKLLRIILGKLRRGDCYGSVKSGVGYQGV